MDSTGISSRSILKVGCGLAAMSASMPASGLALAVPAFGRFGLGLGVTCHWSPPN